MSNALQIFNYTAQHQLRTTVIDGAVWFVAKDVCDVLGLEQVSRALQGLEKDSGLLKVPHPQNPHKFLEVNGVNEPGLYKLIFKSRKPEAEAFQEWVFHEVLPSIRKSGMYLTDKAAEAYLTDPEEFAKMAARCSALERKVEAMERKLEEHYSFSVLGHTVLAQTGAISFKEGAAFLSQHGVPTGQNRLYEYCRKNKLLCSRKGRHWNKPTQKAIDAGLFNVEISGGFNTITMITPAGLKYLTDKLIAEQYPLLSLMEAETE